MPALARDIATDLLRIGAVAFSPGSPITWASGLKSPVYCDNRLTMSHPAVRRRLTEGFVALLGETGSDADVIAGTATAGIPHAAWLAERLGKPMVYVRSKPKGHGRGNQIEGQLAAGAKVVVIEDLVSTGMSSVAVVDVLAEAGAEVLGVFAIFSYGLPKAKQTFAERGVPLHTLTSFPDLLAAAEASGQLTPDALASLRAWHTDPAAWSAERA